MDKVYLYEINGKIKAFKNKKDDMELITMKRWKLLDAEQCLNNIKEWVENVITNDVVVIANGVYKKVDNEYSWHYQLELDEEEMTPVLEGDMPF